MASFAVNYQPKGPVFASVNVGIRKTGAHGSSDEGDLIVILILILISWWRTDYDYDYDYESTTPSELPCARKTDACAERGVFLYWKE